MRRFLKKTFFAVLLLGAIATVLDSVLIVLSRGKQFKPHADFNIINTGRPRPQVVVIGDSRARYGIDPRILAKALGKRCYNLGMNGYPVTEQLAKLRYAIRYNGEPGLVVACMDRGCWQRLRLDTIFQYEQFLDDIRDPLVLDMVKDKVGFRPVDVLPWARFAGFPGYVASIAMGDTLPNAHDGFLADEQVMPAKALRVIVPPYRHDTVHFQSYLQAIRDHRLRYWPKARLVYIEMPFFRSDSDVVMPHLAGQLDPAFECAFTFDLSLADDTSLFLDRTHLNAAGAARFTTMLADSLVARGYGHR
jgi:hypothetical protein